MNFPDRLLASFPYVAKPRLKRSAGLVPPFLSPALPFQFLIIKIHAGPCQSQAGSEASALPRIYLIFLVELFIVILILIVIEYRARSLSMLGNFPSRSLGVLQPLDHVMVGRPNVAQAVKPVIPIVATLNPPLSHKSVVHSQTSASAPTAGRLQIICNFRLTLPGYYVTMTRKV